MAGVENEENEVRETLHGDSHGEDVRCRVLSKVECGRIGVWEGPFWLLCREG